MWGFSVLVAFSLLQMPDTLDAAHVSAARETAPATESASGEELRRAENLADAVRGFSGIQLRDYGGVGGLKTVNVRSLGSAHTAVFVDGVPIDNAQNMQVDLGRIPTGGLAKVELFHGQRSRHLQSAREWGSASALHLSSALPEKQQFHVHFHGGAFGTLAPRLQWENRWKGRWAARVQGGATKAHGHYPFRVSGPGWDTLMTRENCDLQAWQAQAQLFWQPRGGQYQASLRGYSSERGIPGPVYKQSRQYPLSEDRQTDRSLGVQFSGEQQLTPSLQVMLRGKYALDALQYLDVSELDPSVSAQWDYLQQSYYLSLAMGWQALPWLHLGAALDGLAESLQAQLVQPRRQSLFSVLSAALDSGPWHAALALQLQNTSDPYHFLSPSFVLDWHPTPSWEFGGLFKRSCRLPTFNDLYYTNVTARGLQPESVWQASARWRWTHQYGRWHLAAREELYYNRVEDKLIAVPNGSLFRWSMYNLGLVHIFGDELVASAEFQGASFSAGLTARYSFQRAFEPDNGYQIPYIPLHSASFQLYAAWKGLRAEVQGFLCSERLTAASERPEYRLAPWTTWDAFLSYAFRNLRLGLQLRNLLDEQYEIVRQYPMPGFHLLGSIDYSF